MITTSTTTHRQVDTQVTLQAPALALIADALWALHEHPTDPRARICFGLLAHEGLDRCPRCQTAFSVQGYQETRGPGLRQRSLTCSGCPTRFVVEDQQEA